MYTYAFLLPPDHPLHLPPGIKGTMQLVGTETVLAAVEPDLSSLWIDQIQDDDKLLMQAVLDHDRVLRDLFQQTTILPLRFGTLFTSGQGLLSHLEATASTYLNTLHQFQGKAEYALRYIPIEFPEIALPDDLKGKEYFLAKKQYYQAQVEYQNRQQEEFGRLFRQITQTYPYFASNPAENGGGNLYLLIERNQANSLTQQVKSWQQQAEFWSIQLTEALPPYHFLGNEMGPQD